MFRKLLLFVLLFSACTFSQPKEEVRAVWVTTVYNLDWPAAFSNAAQQRSSMIDLLDKLKAANFNTIMLQVRARGDLLYPSEIEPWSKALTGNLGGNPGYDPLQFVLDEAHKRGIEVHAWWNVYKVYGTGMPPNTTPQHIVLKHPELCKLYDNEWWMDPGIPETKTYLLNLAMELIRKYNIDGIHFDFIRYPNPDFLDESTYQQYGNGVSKANWRRNNITQFVSALYDSVKNVKPMLKVGSAPIGIYQDLSQCQSGWDSYSNTYQDSRRWVLARIHDYMAPQIYWDINSCPRFDSLAMNWVANSNGRHIYPGIAVYRMGASDGNWPASEILAQIDSSRVYGANGQSLYRTASVSSNQKNLYNLLKENQYKYPANIPPMPWKDDVKPNAPESLTISTEDSLTYTLTWNKPLPAADGDTAIYYNVYMDNSSPVDINDVKKMVKFRIVNDTTAQITLSSILAENTYFAVTAYDKGYNESAPAEASIIVTSVEDEITVNGFKLHQNYPNPFNPSTRISFEIPASENGVLQLVTLKIYDLLGEEVAQLVNEFKPAGNYEVEFNSNNGDRKLSSGIYFYELRSGASVLTRKMILLQ